MQILNENYLAIEKWNYLVKIDETLIHLSVAIEKDLTYNEKEEKQPITFIQRQQRKILLKILWLMLDSLIIRKIKMKKVENFLKLILIIIRNML